jgi:hypothetical protein
MKKRMAVMVNRQRLTSKSLFLDHHRPVEGAGDRDALSALTGLEARVLLVDDVDAALAANKAVLAVTSLERLERILDLHFSDPRIAGR